MLRLSFLFSCVLFAFINAQSNRFYYEVKFKPDTISGNEVKEFFITDVNPQSIKFYSLVNYEYDSLYKKNGYYAGNYPEITLGHSLKRERNTNKNINYLYAGSVYVQMQTTDEMKWNILPQIKMIGKIKTQAAITSFGGRQWTAWFADSIPISEGPYKFRSLPGMILEVYDKDNYFHFTFVKNKKLEKEYDTSGFLENFGDEKPILINKEKYIHLKQKDYDDPYALFKAEGINTTINENGTEVSVDFAKKTKEKQKKIKALNNTIEKEYIIHYK